eukprot:s1906_g9.t1
MGNTEKSPEEVNRILVCMASEWLGAEPGSEYDLIHHNCLTFCNVLLGELGLRRIPGSTELQGQPARSISADEVSSQAEETLQTLRRDSLAALEAAKGGTQKPSRCTRWRGSVQMVCDATRQVSEIGAKATELAGRAQEQLQSVGASLWQWGQNLQETVGISEAASDIGKKAEDNWQSFSDSLRTWGETVTKDLKQTLEGTKGKPGNPAGGGYHSASPPGDERGTAGLIKAQEASLLKQGLLEEATRGSSGTFQFVSDEDTMEPEASCARGRRSQPDLLTWDEAPAKAASTQAANEWIERMDDEEGEEDEDELFHTGEECIDRVAEAASMETIGNSLFRLIGHFSQQDSWQAKHAALAAVKQTVEYVEEQGHVDEMARLLLSHVDHPHPRVRFTALHGLGQLANDQSPHFQETSHLQVMPVLTRKMDDQVDRVAAMAMSAFVSFGEELDNSLMAGPPILASQVSRPVAVQMAKLPSQAKLETPLGLKGMEKLFEVTDLGVTSSLVQLCHSLYRQSEANKQILAEHVKEQGKLLMEREVLRSRKADLERTLEGPDSLSSSAARLPEIFVQTPVPVSAACAPQAFPLTAPDPVAQEAAEAAKQATSAENTLQTQGAEGAEGAETAVGTAPVEQGLQGDQGDQLAAYPICPKVADSEQMPVTENVTLASPAPISATGNPETACSPDGSKAATGTATSQAVPEEISLASPIRPALQTLQNLAVSLGSPKVEHAVPEIVTLASPMQEAYHGYNAYNLEVKSPAPAEVPLQPDVASGRPLMSPGSPLVAKVTETTSPETPSATTLVAGTSDARKVNGVPCSGDAAAGVGAKSDQDPIKVLSPSYGSLDGSSVLPDCETMGQEKLLEAKQLVLSTPEELMARVEDASIRLTWFFDEDLADALLITTEMLEQLASGPAELSFQIRQQSEGVGGRLRIREHSCAAVYSAKDGAVQEQNFLVEGCAPGRPYTFSIRCRLQLPGAEQQLSDFCEAVTACVPATTPGNKAPASLCSTAASAPELPVEGSCIVPKLAEAAPPERKLAPEACSQFLPDDGCHLRKWLQDHKDSELNRVTQSRAVELTNGKAVASEPAASFQFYRPSRSKDTS